MWFHDPYPKGTPDPVGKKIKARNPWKLPEARAQAVVLVRALEEVDRKGALIDLAERHRATEEARKEFPKGDRWLAHRAQRLREGLEKHIPYLPRLLRWTRPGRGLLPPVVLGMLVLGLLTQALDRGSGRLIQVLAAPLLVLVAWNVVSMALLLVSHWLPLGTLVRPLTDGALSVWQNRLRSRVGSLPRSSSGDETTDTLVSRALGTYLDAWFPTVLPLATLRLRRLLHAGAGALVAGVVLGMYLRGLVWEYRVTWESTFLGTETVQALLDFVLAPAASLLGQPVPEVAALRSPESGLAAPWIHLYAATAALFVLLPRGLLFFFESLRVVRAQRSLRVELPEAYERRLLAAGSAEARRVEILPYSLRLASGEGEALKALLFDFFGPRTALHLRPGAEYGAEADDLDPVNGRCLVILFNLAQTPESEVHGELLRGLAPNLLDGQAMVVLVEGGGYRRRLHGDDPEAARESSRLTQRRRAWDRVLKEAGVAAVYVDLSRPSPQDLVVEIERAAWPEGALSEI